MFRQPGEKIKGLAEASFWLLAITSIILAIVLGFENGDFHPAEFFAFLIGGPISAYVLCLFLYGFGELIENSGKTEKSKTDDELEAKAEIERMEAQAKKDAEKARARAKTDAERARARKEALSKRKPSLLIRLPDEEVQFREDDADPTLTDEEIIAMLEEEAAQDDEKGSRQK